MSRFVQRETEIKNKDKSKHKKYGSKPREMTKPAQYTSEHLINTKKIYSGSGGKY